MLPRYFLLALSILGLSIVSYILVQGVLIWTQRHEILDVPNERSSHTRPTPRGGGLAIVLICLAGWCVYAFTWSDDSGWLIWGYASAAALLALVSFLDDLYGLSNTKRFIAHLAAAILILYTCGWWMSLTMPFVGTLDLGWFGAILSLLWIVGLTNAYNFMDGIDGIAAGQAIVAGIGWLLLGEITGITCVVCLGFLITAASLGFLFHNRPPARIFMGDVGSAFLGFTFAFLAVWAAQQDPRLGVAGVLLVWPFVFDSIFTLLHRLHKGENIFQAHRSHLYQRLVKCGVTHGKVSLGYTLLAASGIVPAVVFVQWPTGGSWLIVILFPLLAGGLWFAVLYREKKSCCRPLQSNCPSQQQSF
jgi:UDP-N-acetylmuramyl pentapeptide phosphotransferase/UDP-N-acetylglucosamine-1-phosphate transferase